MYERRDKGTPLAAVRSIFEKVALHFEGGGGGKEGFARLETFTQKFLNMYR